MKAPLLQTWIPACAGNEWGDGALERDLSGWWSRRIDGEHRLVYRGVESGGAVRVQVAQCRYHY